MRPIQGEAQVDADRARLAKELDDAEHESRVARERECYVKEAEDFTCDEREMECIVRWAFVFWAKTEPDFSLVHAAHERLRANMFTAANQVKFEDIKGEPETEAHKQMRADAVCWLKFFPQNADLGDTGLAAKFPYLWSLLSDLVPVSELVALATPFELA